MSGWYEVGKALPGWVEELVVGCVAKEGEEPRVVICNVIEGQCVPCLWVVVPKRALDMDLKRYLSEEPLSFHGWKVTHWQPFPGPIKKPFTPFGDWVDTDDSLPGWGIEVLVNVESCRTQALPSHVHDFRVAYLCHREEWYSALDKCKLLNNYETVTHWVALPKGPPHEK